MSDWEEEMYDESEEELSFDDDNDDDVEMVGDEIDSSQNLNTPESLYFQAKSLKDDGLLNESLSMFKRVIDGNKIDSTSDFDYIFKAIKQSIKILTKLNDYDSMLSLFDLLFRNAKHVESSYGANSIFKIIVRFDKTNVPSEFQKKFGQKCSDYLDTLSETERSSPNIKRIKMKLDLFLVNFLISEGALDSAMDLLRSLELNVKMLTGTTKKAYMLDIIVSQLSILMQRESNLNEIKRLVSLSNEYMSGIPHSKVVGVVNEANGVVKMYEKDYNGANIDFQTSFKGYNDSSDSRRISVMTKYIFSSLLSKSHVNPFDSNDFQSLLKIPSVNHLMELYNSVLSNDIIKFNEVRKQNYITQMLKSDKFIMDFFPLVMELVKCNYLLKIVPLLKKVSFKYLSFKLESDEREIENLVLKLYSRGYLTNTKIDFNAEYIEQIDDSPPIIPKGLDAYQFIDKMLLLKDEATDLDQITASIMNYQNAVEDGYIPNQSSLNVIKLDKVMKSQQDLTNENLIKRFYLLYNQNHPFSDYINDLYPFAKFVKQYSWNNNSDIIDIVEFYIKLITTGVPTRRDVELNRIQKAKYDVINSEYQKIYNNNDFIMVEDWGRNSNFPNDSNIPEVVKVSEMGAIEPPVNINENVDERLSHRKKLQRKIELIENIINTVSDNQVIATLSSIKQVNGIISTSSLPSKSGSKRSLPIESNNFNFTSIIPKSGINNILDEENDEGSMTEASEFEDKEQFRPISLLRALNRPSPTLQRIRSLHFSEGGSGTSDSNDEMEA